MWDQINRRDITTKKQNPKKWATRNWLPWDCVKAYPSFISPFLMALFTFLIPIENVFLSAFLMTGLTNLFACLMILSLASGVAILETRLRSSDICGKVNDHDWLARAHVRFQFNGAWIKESESQSHCRKFSRKRYFKTNPWKKLCLWIDWCW